MPLLLDSVQQLAPDQASLKAAASLLKPGQWPLLGTDPARSLLWGECQGSGSSPYRVAASAEDLGFKCTCPSRKQPCKHSLALLWIGADRAGWLRGGTAPDWVEDWAARRRKRGATPSPTAPEEGPPPPAKDLGAALAPASPSVAEDKARQQAAKLAARRREEREASVLAGLSECERWVADVLEEGLGTFPGRATERCRRIAARLVDAKAGGLATWLDELPAALFSLPDDARPSWLLQELGRLVLLLRAYRRQAQLPPALREEVRAQVGWSLTRDALLDHPLALRVRDRWTVLHVRSRAQADRLIRQETWLRRHGPGQPDFALLLDFAPPGLAKPSAWRGGEVLSAELVFYPSPTPLRAQIAEREAEDGATAPEPALASGFPGLDQASIDAARRLAQNPWLDPLPTVVHGVTVAPRGDQLLACTEDGAGLPLVGELELAHYALAACSPCTAALLLEPGGARLLAATTPFGWWSAP